MPSFDPFRGPPVLNEWQRQGIGMIPYLGPVYNAFRAGNAIVKGFQGMTGNLPANQALPTSDPDYGNPNYIGLGDPVGTPTAAAPAPGRMTPQSYQAIASPQAPAGGVNTALLSSNARNAIGLGTPGFFGGYKGSLDSGTQLWMNDIASRTQR